MGVVHVGRTHLRAPPWVPGYPGKTMGPGTTMWCVIPLAGYFRTNAIEEMTELKLVIVHRS